MTEPVRIHIVGASGSGTTTLGNSLAQALKIPHWDTDDFYWEKTNPPYTTKRAIPERLRLLSEALDRSDSWVLSGSLVSWGESLIHRFSHVVFLYIPQDVRIERILQREKDRHGKRISVGGDMHQLHLDFIEWAKQYDHGGLDVRSKKMHEAWMQNLQCPIIKIETPEKLEHLVQIVTQAL